MVCFNEVTTHFGSFYFCPTKSPSSFSSHVSQYITLEPPETSVSFPVQQRSGCQNIRHRVRQEHLTRGIQCRSSPVGSKLSPRIPSTGLLTADDVTRLSVEVEGWSVIVEASGVLVGRVEEVLQLASVSDSDDDEDYHDVINDHETTCNDDDADTSSGKDTDTNPVSVIRGDHDTELGSDKWQADKRIPVRDSIRIEEYMLRISGEKMMGRRLEFLVPLVPAIVTAVDQNKRRLFINVGCLTKADCSDV